MSWESREVRTSSTPLRDEGTGARGGHMRSKSWTHDTRYLLVSSSTHFPRARPTDPGFFPHWPLGSKSPLKACDRLSLVTRLVPGHRCPYNSRQQLSTDGRPLWRPSRPPSAAPLHQAGRSLHKPPATLSHSPGICPHCPSMLP